MRDLLDTFFIFVVVSSFVGIVLSIGQILWLFVMEGAPYSLLLIQVTMLIAASLNSLGYMLNYVKPVEKNFIYFSKNLCDAQGILIIFSDIYQDICVALLFYFIHYPDNDVVNSLVMFYFLSLLVGNLILYFVGVFGVSSRYYCLFDRNFSIIMNWIYFGIRLIIMLKAITIFLVQGFKESFNLRNNKVMLSLKKVIIIILKTLEIVVALPLVITEQYLGEDEYDLEFLPIIFSQVFKIVLPITFFYTSKFCTEIFDSSRLDSNCLDSNCLDSNRFDSDSLVSLDSNEFMIDF